MALTRLKDTDLALTPFAPQFTEIAASTLGNFGENSDGFDSIMSVPLASFSPDVDAMGQLDQHLLDMDFNEGEFAGNVWTPIGVTMQPFTDTGDALLSAFGDAVTPPDTNPPPVNNPPPAVNPPPGVGGGGGGFCDVGVDPITGDTVFSQCGTGGAHGPGVRRPEVL